MSKPIDLPITESCFICGRSNPYGLKMQFTAKGGEVTATLTPPPVYMGYEGVLHGGIITALLDETMGWAAALAVSRMCMAAEMTVRFRRPVLIGSPITIKGRFVENQRRILIAEGRIIDSEDNVLATATGKFLPISDEKAKQIDREYLIYPEGGKKLFSGNGD